MKISILGSRGIPNNYGGFEQCAENLSLKFIEKNHKVVVYNNSDSSYKKKSWKQIKIHHVYSNESILKSFNVFLTDFLSILHAIRNKNDIILALGSAPNPLYYHLKYFTNAKIITNLAGLEWKRSKWGRLAKMLIKFCEKRAVKMSDALVSDNIEIQKYIKHEYGELSEYIAYGTKSFDSPKTEVLNNYLLKEYNYYMCVARSQPDNNIEMIIEGLLMADVKEPIIIVGNYNNKFGKYLKRKYKSNQNVVFTGGIYNFKTLSTLRYFSKLYIHGHSCGGTNPALLDAMASNSLIAAHGNRFNKTVLGSDGFYFTNSKELSLLINEKTFEKRTVFCKNNKIKVKNNYSWKKISDEYLELFEKILIT